MGRDTWVRTATPSPSFAHLLLIVGFGVAGAMGSPAVRGQAMCGGQSYPFPYTDVSGVGGAFCPGIMEAYVTGVSKGTSPTTFSPNESVIRLDMTTFLQRSLDQLITRASRRASLNQWWVPQDTSAMQLVAVGGSPAFCAIDGENIWTATNSANQVVQVQANTGKIIGTWSAANNSIGVVEVAGKIFATGASSPGNLYVLDPTVPGVVTVAASNLGNLPMGIAFDGTNLWTANNGGSVSIITPQSPYTVTTVTSGFTAPSGIVYDGAHIWVTDGTAGKLFQLNGSGGIVQTVNVGAGPGNPAFDGTNIWVPNSVDNTITVIQASSGAVVGTITANASILLNGPSAASFDGARILVTNSTGNSVTVFKAADLSFLANVTTGPSTGPSGACSDGINFWVDLAQTGQLLRF